jgi:hypothetical protein
LAGVGAEVEVAIVASTLAKRDMDVDAGQFVYF